MRRHFTAQLTTQFGCLTPAALSVCVCESEYLLTVCIMFVLVEMVDTVRISPWNFQRQLNEAIAEELNKKLANKVFITV